MYRMTHVSGVWALHSSTCGGSDGNGQFVGPRTHIIETKSCVFVNDKNDREVRQGGVKDDKKNHTDKAFGVQSPDMNSHRATNGICGSLRTRHCLVCTARRLSVKRVHFEPVPWLTVSELPYLALDGSIFP
jgi:hypothetical protein